MGAFDGYWGGYGGHCGSGTDAPTKPKKVYDYFSNQSSFNFFKGFEMPELKALLAKADLEECNKVWVPHERPGWGHIGLHTWYVRALIKEHDV